MLVMVMVAVDEDSAAVLESLKEIPVHSTLRRVEKSR